VDEDAGSDGAYVERCITSLQNSHSSIVVLCNDTLTLSTSSASSGLVAGVYAVSNIRAMDEFASMATQFNTFRVRAVRFDVYDINQGIAATNAFSTFHDVIPAGNTYNPPPLAQTIDGPDAKNVPPGLGKASFFWRAKGTLENEFQSVDAGESVDFGGLRYGFYSPTISSPKYQFVVRAVVDFRGRL